MEPSLWQETTERYYTKVDESISLTTRLLAVRTCLDPAFPVKRRIPGLP